MLLRQLWEEKADSENSFTVDYEAIRKKKYKLSINEYREKRGTRHWVKLGGRDGLCNIKIGGTPPTNDDRCWNGTHLWVKIRDMKQMYITDTEKKITDLGVKRSNAKLLPKGTVLFSFKLSIGKVAIAGRYLYTNEAIAGIIPKDARVLRKYLYYILPRLDYSTYTQPAAKGKTLNKSILEKIRIPLPSKAMQKRMIRIMDNKESAKQRHLKTIERLTLEESNIVAKYVGLS